MVRPFIILALPRSGTKMVARALSHHPEIPEVTHEFRGTEDEYRSHPYVLSNFLHDWMLADDIARIHIAREDAVAGAISILTMGYNFPDDACYLPIDEVRRQAKERERREAQMAKAAHYVTSYERLTDGGQETTALPDWFLRHVYKLLNVSYHPLKVPTMKERKIRFLNQGDAYA